MNKYITWSDLWYPIRAVEYENEDAELTMLKLIGMLKKRAHGRFAVQKNQIIYIRDYNYDDYKWSTSIMGSEEQAYRVEQNKKLLDAIHVEEACIDWLLDHVNDEFEGWDDVYLKVFFERYYEDASVDSIKIKYQINNRRYYSIQETVEYLVKMAWLLINPPQELIDMIGDT